MKKSVYIMVIMALVPSAEACQCFPSYTSKTYQEIKETWYGKKVSYSCLYECVENGSKEVVEGFHQKKIMGKESGNEIVCDGTIYKETYVSSTGWFRWDYVGSEWFSPTQSNSKDLKNWAKKNCN